MDLNLRQVRAFVAVARLSSFTRAAERLHVSQSALTVQIRKLEEALRCRLLDRNSRSVQLTRIGRELLPRLQRTLEDVDSLVDDLWTQGAGRGGTVRIASLPSFAAGRLPDAILAFRRRHPAVGFVVRDAVASRVMQLVAAEEVDVGITGGGATHPDVEVLHRGEDVLCAVMPRTHALARRRSLRASDLVDVPLVLTDGATSVRAVVDAAFRAQHREPRVACEATYMMTAVAMVRAGLGITILPATAREVRVERGLVSRPMAEAAFRRPIAIVKRKGRTLLPVAEEFGGICAEALGVA
jgi:DNA-binding transcriptional LysR family regulator